MNSEPRRLVQDQSFEQAIETVLDALLAQGFVVEPVVAGDCQSHALPSEPLRYALLEATLSELNFRRSPSPRSSRAFLGCRLSVFELVGSCTLITVEQPFRQYPLLACLVPRLTERMDAALDSIMRRGTAEKAA
jgi:hypothetical protein